MKIQVIGLGTVGLPTAIHVSRFFDTIGYDISLEARRNASKFIRTSDRILKADGYIVIVSTGLKHGKPVMTAIYDVAEEIAKINNKALVCIESTVPVGTCRDLAVKFGLERVAHCPHRFWKGDPEKHGVVQMRVLGAINEKTLEAAKEFYTKLGIPLHIVSSIEVAEMSKIVENSYRFVQIAFAEEVKMICDRLGLDFNEVRAACNTKWNVAIPEARNGIGGHCLPKDTRYLKASAQARVHLLNGAIKADNLYKRWLQWKESML